MTSPTRAPWLKRHALRLRKHALWLSAAVTGQVLCRALLPEPWLKGTNDVGGSFLQTFGGMYGVIVAFAMFVVWQQHNETQLAIEREAVSLGELHRLLAWFTTWADRADARTRLHRYALELVVHHGHADDQGHVLDATLDELLRHQPGSPHEERLYQSAIDLFHELHEAREHRITVGRLRLPESLRWFLYLGGAMVVAALWVVWVESPLVHAGLTAGMTWVVVAATSIVIDLDDPYSGDFIVHWNRFAEVAQEMVERPDASAAVEPHD